MFVGWSGPLGIAAVFDGVPAVERTGTDRVWHAASLVVAGSVLVHGMTSTPLTHWYGGLADPEESW